MTRRTRAGSTSLPRDHRGGSGVARLRSRSRSRSRSCSCSSSWSSVLGAAALCLGTLACGTNQIEGIGSSGNTGAGSAGGPSVGPSGFDVGTSACPDPSADASDMGFPRPFVAASTPSFVTLGNATEPPPPISGGTLLVLRDGVTAVAADADRDRVYVVNLSDANGLPVVRASIALAPRDQPGRLVEDGAGHVHVALSGSGVLATIDVTSGQVIMRRTVCPLPKGLAYDAVADRLLLACAGGELLTLPTGGGAPDRTLRLPSDLRDVVVDGARVLVTRFRSAEVMVLDQRGTMVELIRLPSFRNLAVHSDSPFSPAVAWRTVGRPGGGAVMVHQRGLSGTVGQTPGGYGGMSPCDTIVHTSVTMVRSGERPVPGPAMPGFVLPVDVAVSPDGKRAAMVAAGNGHASSGGARKLFVADVDDVTQEWADGCATDDRHGPSATPLCSSQVPGMVADIPGGCPMGLVFCQGRCIDPATTLCPTGSARTDGPPVTSPSSFFCNVDIVDAVEPVAVAFSGPDLVVVQTREPAQLWTVSLVTGRQNRVVLSQESRADAGHAIFHSNSGGGLACASCHPEGHEDGRVWNFACEGPRRTQDLSGGLSGTEPFHWGGDLADFPKLVDTVFVGRMSGPPLTRDQTRAALGWINAVPAKPPVRPSSDVQVQRGKVIFESSTAGCATCHSGAALTNNATVNVGTSEAFQVPSLRGIGWRAPFMHDGCAATLAGRFGNRFCDGGDAHGKTSQLAAAQLDDLVAYLESL